MSTPIRHRHSDRAMDGTELINCLRTEPEQRTAEDVAIVFSYLQSLRVFENYPEDFLQEVALFATYEETPAHVTLFRPGDDGLFWYAVISGSLEMLHCPNSSNKTQSICSLGEGNSFGEGVIVGNKRETMIVTSDECELLCVEAKHIRSIYEKHKDSMKDIMMTPAGRPLSLTSSDGDEETDAFHEEDLQLSTPVKAIPETELTMAGMFLYQVIQDHFPELIADHQVNMYTYQKCCSGQKLVDWVMSQSIASRSRAQVVAMWQALLMEGILQHVLCEHQFQDDPLMLYQFVEKPISESVKTYFRPSSPKTAKTFESLLDSPVLCRAHAALSVCSSSEISPVNSPRSSITSILEECFDIIAQQGPEAMIFSTLLKRPSERTDDDIQLIYDELLHVKAFGHLTNAIKEELATIVEFENHLHPGKYLYKEGDPGTSWYIILKGSVNLVIGGKIMCTLSEGDDFGRLALVNNAPRTTSIQLREPNCCFLRVDSEDYRRILLSVERNTVKVRENGKEVLLLERIRTGGRYQVVKGTPQNMLDYLFSTSNCVDDEHIGIFAQDFFLTYPAFMTLQQLCDCLLQHYKSTLPLSPNPLTQRHSSFRGSITPSVDGEGGIPTPTGTPEELKSRKKRVVWAVGLWVEMARAELVKDVVFQGLLKQLQECLVRDQLEDDLRVMNTQIMNSMRQAPVGGVDASKSGSSLSISFGLKKPSSEVKIEMGICAIPACQPIDTAYLRVHTHDKRCCRLHRRLDSTAMEILREACTKLDLNAEEHELCEIRSTGDKTIFKQTDLSITTEMSVNGRLYALPCGWKEPVAALPDQIPRPTQPFPENESSREIACQLCVHDWNLFNNIQQMEFIYQVFGRHRFSKITSNLDVLNRRFNEIQYWVITEICNEPNLQKRAKILTKFIKISSYCKSYNNLNSFFAVVIGLMNGAVERLKLTWERVPARLRRRFRQFVALTDPSRNHRVLRAYENKLPSPVIPFMPLFIKDAFFLHEGNQTYIEGLVNFEKMRMVASKVRNLEERRKGIFPTDLRQVANKNPNLQKYIRELRVIDNQQVLMKMSHSIEPRGRTHSFTS